MTEVSYRHEVLEYIVVLYAEITREIFIFMDDNFRSHGAKVVIKYLEKHGIRRMDEPSKCLQLNPRKHVRNMIGRSIGNLEAKPRCLQQLGVALVAEQDAMDVRDINRLIEFKRQRCVADIFAAGGHACYQTNRKPFRSKLLRN